MLIFTILHFLVVCICNYYIMTLVLMSIVE
nr:MAG TPA: hypothetical protein [Caudoviricetes sp.]